MDRTVHLHGELAQFGSQWEVEAPIMADILKLIDCQTEGFRKYLIEAAEAGLELAMVVGNDRIETPEELLLKNKVGDVHLALMPSGSKRGWGKVILGAIIIGLSIWFGMPTGGTWAQVMAGEISLTFAATMGIGIGINIAMAGLAELMTSAPEHNKAPEAGLFNGPDSTIQQGTPVPVAYGKILVGGKPISVNFKASGVTGTGRGGGGGSVYSGLWDNVYVNSHDWLNDLDEVQPEQILDAS